jgi:hypothetical protein
MPKISVMYDNYHEYKMRGLPIKTTGKTKRKKERTLQIDDNLFNIGIQKGLIEKIDDQYVFIGDYEKLLAFKNKRN